MSRPDLRPLAIIATLWAGALFWAWALAPGIRQNRVIATMVASVLALGAALVWFLVFSHLPRRSRRAGGLAVVALLAAGLGVFEFAGVTGDVRPVFHWRWGRRSVPAPELDRRSVLAVDIRPTLADWPRFLGPRNTGVVDAVLLARRWDHDLPREIWRRPVGSGWGSFAIQGDIAVTLEQREQREAVAAYALDTGEPVWLHDYPARYDSPVAGLGPRSTPTIEGDRVYTFGATGVLTALDLASGVVVWSRDVLAETGASIPSWGKSCSPLVLDGMVVVSAGGPDGHSLVAYDAATGAPRWSAGNGPSGYASPQLATLAGVRQVLIFNSAEIAAHAPGDGSLLWTFPWPAQQPNVAQPLVLAGDSVIASSGYGVGAKRFRVARQDDGRLVPSLMWESIRLKAKFAHFVVHAGTLYGLDDGVLTAVDPETGDRLWKGGRYGHGQLLLVEDLLLIQAEAGDLVLVGPNPRGLNELARTPVLSGRAWNVPALAGNRLLVRNDREAALYVLPLRQ